MLKNLLDNKKENEQILDEKNPSHTKEKQKLKAKRMAWCTGVCATFMIIAGISLPLILSNLIKNLAQEQVLMTS